MSFPLIINRLKRFLHLISKDEYRKTKDRILFTPAQLLKCSQLFDEKWYAKQHPEIRQSNISAFHHYLTCGLKNKFPPAANFDCDYFIRDNIPALFYQYDPNLNLIEAPYESRPAIAKFDFKPHKMLLISHALSSTGAPRALLSMAKELKTMGHNPVVISPAPGNLELELRACDLEYYVEPLFLAKLIFQDRMLAQFLNSFENILFNTLLALPYAKYIENRKIAWIHEAKDGYENANHDELSASFPHVDKVYSVSSYAKTFTDTYVPAAKSEVLTLSIDDNSHLAKEATGAEMYFLAVGVIAKVKGFEIFIDAVKSLPLEVKAKCRFAIAGKIFATDYARELADSAKDAGIALLGELSYLEVLGEMNRAKVIVSSSLDESLSMVIAEGMMLRKVVICPTSCGISDHIESGVDGFLYTHGRDNLADILLKVYRKRDEFETIGNLAQQKFFKVFSKETFRQNLECLFQK